MKRTPEEILEQMDALLDEFESAKDKFDRGAFADKFGERLGSYSDKLKALNGDDFDIVSSAYDEHKKDYSDLSDDDYVNALEENIKKVIARVWPEMPEEAVEEVAEQVANEADGETTETTITTETKPEESTSDETVKQRTTGAWGNPSTSGGRTGKCGIIKGGKKSDGTSTSDEDCKEEGETLKDVAEATPSKVDDLVVEAVTAKPEEVDKGEYKVDDNDPFYKKFH